MPIKQVKKYLKAFKIHINRSVSNISLLPEISQKLADLFGFQEIVVQRSVHLRVVKSYSGSHIHEQSVISTCKTTIIRLLFGNQLYHCYIKFFRYRLIGILDISISHEYASI